jgi:hypothetical protein
MDKYYANKEERLLQKEMWLNKEKNLEKLKTALKKYNNKKMPDDLQKEISDNWNNLSLWRFVNYWAVQLDLKTWKP